MSRKGFNIQYGENTWTSIVPTTYTIIKLIVTVLVIVIIIDITIIISIYTHYSYNYGYM